MRTALIYVRVIVAVSMTSAGIFFAQSVEGFQKYRARPNAVFGPLNIMADSDPSIVNRARLQTARAFKRLGEEAIRAGEVNTLVVSGIFGLLSLCAILAGNCLKAGISKPP